MKKVLLVVALLLLATPIFAADVTITATQTLPASTTNLQQVTIGYTGAATADAIRAFALSITTDLTDNNAVFSNIRGFVRGESKTGNLGYGIFPARFRQYITPLNGTDVNSTGGYGWADGNYTPLAVWGDANAGWGIDTKWIVTEQGTLYTGDTNAPGTSGTLFVIDVNNPDKKDCNMCIALDQIRGGVIKKDTTAATVTLPAGGSGAPAGCIRVSFAPPCTTILNEVGQQKATAEAAWIGQGFSVSGTAGTYSDTIPANQVTSQDTGCKTLPYTVNYVYSKGKFPTATQLIYPKWDPDANLPVYWSQVAGATSYDLDRSANGGGTWTNVYSGTATFKAESVPVGIYRYRCRAKNADSTGDYYTATYDCNAYLSTCYKGGLTTDANWAQWKSVGRPDCWCKATTAQEPNGTGYQCDGDADGTTNVSGYRVYSADLTMLSNNYKKTAAQVTNDPNVTLQGKFKIQSSGCADFDHKANVSGYRVYSLDLGILSANYKKLNSSSVTATNKLPGNCPR